MVTHVYSRLIVQMGQRMLREEVTAADIAEVTAKWTGIPVSSCDLETHPVSACRHQTWRRSVLMRRLRQLS